MKTIMLFFLLLTQLITSAQNLNDIENTVDKILKTNSNGIKKSITSEYKDLIGKTITSDKNYNSFYEKIHFVNDKYFLTIKKERTVLGIYKLINIKGDHIILLFDEYKTNYKALIFALKNKKKYVVHWKDNSGNHSNDTATLTEEEFKNQELDVHKQIVSELNFFNPNISFYVKNKKIGIKLRGQKLIKNECDSLFIYGKIATVYNSNKINLYNLKGKLLEENLKADYSYSRDEHQIIDSQNKMYFIDTLGIKYNKPKKTYLRPGNDYYKEKHFVTYYAHKKTILKTTIICSPKFTKDSVKLEDSFSYIKTRPSEEDEDFIKKVFKNKKKYTSEISEYYFNNEIDRYYSDYIKLPENYKKIRFINNSTKRIHFEYNSLFSTYHLNTNYIVAKKSNKYGVWDIEKNKIIIPFNYKEIVIKESWFVLKQNKLYTFYPNIGLKPKYTCLEDYIVQFAKFKYPNGKKGWVDRKGKEYFD